MNKKGFEFKSGLFAIVAVSLLVLAFGVIISEQADFYNTEAVSEIAAYNKLSDISETAGGYRSDLSPGDRDPQEDAETSTFRGVYGILTGMFGAFDLIVGDDGLLDNVMTQFGIPAYVRQGVITLMLIAIAMSLIAVIFRLARRSA